MKQTNICRLSGDIKNPITVGRAQGAEAPHSRLACTSPKTHKTRFKTTKDTTQNMFLHLQMMRMMMMMMMMRQVGDKLVIV